MKTFLGIDGCRSGWLTVKITEDDIVTLSIYDTIRSVWSDNHDAEMILIDIPIGLPDTGNGTRACDSEARKVLKPYRASSVYPVPCREALYAENYKQASAINKKLTGKGLSKQSWMISPKIREVDTFLHISQKPGYSRDDIVDAFAAALTARLSEGKLDSLQLCKKAGQRG